MQKIITIDAEALIVQASIPVRGCASEQKTRAARSLPVGEAQRLANQKRSWQQLELLLAVNFPTPGSGIVSVATFDDDHRPLSRGETQRRFAYFRQKLRAARLAADLPAPVIVWAPEVLTSYTNRWHVHFVVDSTGHDFDMLRRCWPYGGNLDLEPLRVDRHKNHETLAKYMSKELRDAQDYSGKAGLHGWSCTRNARRPEIDVMLADDARDIAPPECCEVLVDESRGGEGAEYHYIKSRVRL